SRSRSSRESRRDAEEFREPCGSINSLGVLVLGTRHMWCTCVIHPLMLLPSVHVGIELATYAVWLDQRIVEAFLWRDEVHGGNTECSGWCLQPVNLLL